MAVKLTRLTNKIAIQPHLVAKSCTICSSRSRRPVRKLSDTLSYSKQALDTLSVKILPKGACSSPAPVWNRRPRCAEDMKIGQKGLFRPKKGGKHYAPPVIGNRRHFHCMLDFFQSDSQWWHKLRHRPQDERVSCIRRQRYQLLVFPRFYRRTPGRVPTHRLRSSPTKSLHVHHSRSQSHVIWSCKPIWLKGVKNTTFCLSFNLR
jgi:hypothetical protein